MDQFLALGGGLPHWQAFALALAIGALMGVEREKHRRDSGNPVAGLHTFILVAEAGALSAWLGEQTGQPWLLAAALLAISLPLALSVLRDRRGMVAGGALGPEHGTPVREDGEPERRRPPERPTSDAGVAAAPAAGDGLTTLIAALVTFLLGAVCIHGPADIAVALGIASSAILAFREPLHGLVARIGTDDLYAGLKLLIASFIVLPLLPDRPLDPWQIFNPFKIWLLVILISGLSLVGYVLTRWLGTQRGTAMTALAGALVSSTAVTLELARRARDGSAPPVLISAGMLLAWGMMYLRMLLALGVVHPPLLKALALPCLSLAALCMLAGAIGLRRAGPEEDGALHIRNPFNLVAAGKFAALFVCILALVRLSQYYFPGGSLYAVASLAGLVDVDAIVLSSAELARTGGELGLVSGAILLATLANTGSKLGLALVIGGRSLRRYMLPAALVLTVLTLGFWWLA